VVDHTPEIKLENGTEQVRTKRGIERKALGITGAMPEKEQNRNRERVLFWREGIGK